MNSHQLDIVRLAWSRRLGLPDDVVLGDVTPRVVAVDEAATTLEVVILDGMAVIAGPQDAVDAVQELPNEVLGTRAGLCSALGARAGRSSSAVTLAYADDTALATGIRENPLVSHERAHLSRVASAVAPDDADEAALSTWTTWFTVLDDTDGQGQATAVAAAGYCEWEGLLGDMGAVTLPDRRRERFGATAARLATNDAVDAGLIPQWRCHLDNVAGRLFAAELGYVEYGVRIVIALLP